MLHLAEDPRRIGQTVGHPGTLGADVAGGEASIWALNAALRQLGNRLVGILHGCLKRHTLYDEATAWNQHTQQAAA